jgi:hypothetical protein
MWSSDREPRTVPLQPINESDKLKQARPSDQADGVRPGGPVGESVSLMSESLHSAIQRRQPRRSDLITTGLGTTLVPRRDARGGPTRRTGRLPGVIAFPAILAPRRCPLLELLAHGPSVCTPLWRESHARCQKSSGRIARRVVPESTRIVSNWRSGMCRSDAGPGGEGCCHYNRPSHAAE